MFAILPTLFMLGDDLSSAYRSLAAMVICWFIIVPIGLCVTLGCAALAAVIRIGAPESPTVSPSTAIAPWATIAVLSCGIAVWLHGIVPVGTSFLFAFPILLALVSIGGLVAIIMAVRRASAQRNENPGNIR